MPKRTLLYLATDKEVFDVIMSSRLRFTETVMLSLPRARGIFYAPTEERASLAEALALLSYDFDGLTKLLQHRDMPQRSEKTTTRTLAAKQSFVSKANITATFYPHSRGRSVAKIASTHRRTHTGDSL